jgi:tetratricopeptide (TPR) repeat protein
MGWRTEQAATGLRVVTARKTSKPAGGMVRSLYKKYSLRAAACMLIVASSAFLFKYLSISSQSLYDRYYSSYDLNTARGAGDEQPIAKAYDAKDWSTVLSLAGTAKTKDNQTEFLAGMADLELKQYDDAISHFEEVIAVNSHAGTDYYQDESEYYLAISWLARNKVNEAMPILEKIRSNVHHQYHEKVAKMSFFDLRLAQYKENK